MSINPESLLLEGARRVDEWGLIEKKIPSFDLVFGVDRDRVHRRSRVRSRPPRKPCSRCWTACGMCAASSTSRDSASSTSARRSTDWCRRASCTAWGAPERRSPSVSDARVEEHRNLGIAFYKTGMLDEAMREFRRVAELRPADAGAPFYLGLVLPAPGQVGGRRRGLRGSDDSAQRQGGGVPQPRVCAGAAGPLRGGGGRAGARPPRGAERDDPRVRTSLGVLALRRGELAPPIALLTAARPLWGTRPPAAAWFHYAALAAALVGELERAVGILQEGVGRTRTRPLCTTIWPRSKSDAVHLADAATAVERGLQEDAGLAQLHKNAGDQAYRAARLRRGARRLSARRARQSGARGRLVPQDRQHPVPPRRTGRRRCDAGSARSSSTPTTRSSAAISRPCGGGSGAGMTDAGVPGLGPPLTESPEASRETAEFVALLDEDHPRAGLRLRQLQGEMPAPSHRRPAPRRGLAAYADYARLLDADPPRVRQAARHAHHQRHEALSQLGHLRGASAHGRSDALGDARPRPLNVWSAGCASGEEPYSLAILFHRHADRAARRLLASSRVHVLGTDIDRESLARPRRGRVSRARRSPTRQPDLRAAYFCPASPAAVDPAVRALVRFRDTI